MERAFIYLLFTIYYLRGILLCSAAIPIFQKARQEPVRVKSRPLHQNLDTAYVNLAALVRYLQQRKLEGHVHVELDEYDADILLSGDGEPRVRERDHATGREAEGGDALQRLFVRAIQPGGLVSVYETVAEEMHVEDELSVGAEIAESPAHGS